MLTFCDFNMNTEKFAARGKTIRDYDDMDAALLEMRTIIPNGMTSSKCDMSRMWTTKNSPQTSGNRLLLSKLKSVQVLLTESYNFFQSNPPQPDDKSYNVNSVCFSDNYRRVKGQVKIIQKSLGNIGKLPIYENLPRIYAIAQEIVSGTDGDFDIKFLVDCLKQFQRKINLNLEELWTVPVILQLVILEHIGFNLASVVMKYAATGNSKQLTPRNVEEWLTMVTNDDQSEVKSEFLLKIRAQIEENSKDFDFVVPCIGRSEGQSDIDITFLMKSLSMLSSLELEEIGFVEQLSIIDRTFEKSSGNNFQLLDRTTKSRYRLAVHQICKFSLKSEEETARLAVELSANHRTDTVSGSYKDDIGYFLIDDGLSILQKMSEMKLSAVRRFQQYFCPRLSIIHYVKGILFLSITLSSLFLLCFDSEFSDRYWCRTLIFICTFIVSTQWASEIINYLATKLVTPNLLPRFDFTRTGIPTKFRTIVVVPCLISNFKSINSLISKLEIRFVGNKDENLDFALLTDFEDSNQETLPTDRPLLEYLKAKILLLNEKYSKIRGDGSSIFFAFHRPRVFNPVDNIWMGYERKRGKLVAFTNFLRGIEMENFNFVVGDISKLKFIKYVITLDTDTTLPRDVARKLVATMAHPLNTPVFSHNNRSIDRGYGILQPRTSLNLPAADSTQFSKIFSTNYVGLDQYSRTVSNVYQDLFDESSYVGKGIYDVDVFQQILTGKFQDNHILSHDLLEGNYMRTGFVGDVQLYEDFPSSYISDLIRRHRWIRGDWQNVDFLADKNMSALSLWKIFDNLRRSLVPVCELVTFLCHWHTSSVLFLLGMKFLFSLLLDDLTSFSKLFMKFTRKSKYFFELPRRKDLTESLTSVVRSILLFSFEISCLPNEAFHSADAIIRTIFRRLVSKRNLLEWTASDSSKAESGQKFASIFRKMLAGPVVFLVVTVLMKTEAILLPILLGWAFSPIFAWYISQSPAIKPKKSVLTGDDISYLRRIARKTWSYFEQFNTKEENYLPPDNYREFPNELIAHRTSPTNIGLAVLANLTAYDFGYLSCSEMTERISNTLTTLDGLEKYRGHFYNWYDTQSTDILQPKYVSSVDSGNLHASLLVLRQGLLALPNEQFISNRMFEGLLDTLSLSFDELQPRFDEVALELQSTLVEAMRNRNSLSVTYQYLRSMQLIASEISDFVDSEKLVWFKKFVYRLATAVEELSTIAPWLKLDDIPLELLDTLNRPATLRDIVEYPLTFTPQLDELTPSYSGKDLDNLKEAINEASSHAIQMINLLERLGKTCDSLTSQMEYGFLYDTQRKLLRIGYNVDKNLPDDSCYDLLASEARLGIFVAVAEGKIPQETWFKLGRKLTKNSKVLQSWTGSMFEYLMPQLLLPTFQPTQLSRTFDEIVRIQIDYGREHSIPWGISESSCSTWVTSSQDYFYRPAGMTELSLDPILENSFAIAPYATMLALMVCPKEACSNLKEMSRQKFEGIYGFYEAGDFAPISLGDATDGCAKMVRTFMAHHQAMSFLALENVLLNEPMQRRLASDPNVNSSLILLK